MSILTALFGNSTWKIDKLESNIEAEQKRHKATKSRAKNALHEFEKKTKDHLTDSYKDTDRRLSDQ